MKLEEFKPGMKIKMREDEGDGPKWVRGKVKEVRGNSVMVDWDDLMTDEPIEHFEDEFLTMRPVL